MRERSHKLGENYQQDVKHWLIRGSFLGFEVESFGDAYDLTKKACTIGDQVFDFSLKLRRGGVTRSILYGECKYRNERRGKSVDPEFKEFLCKVYKTVAGAEDDDADNAVFVFLSNIPVDGWREYLRDRQRFCGTAVIWGTGQVSGPVLTRVVQNVHLLTLSSDIVSRG
jgi:hypothetical protein